MASTTYGAALPTVHHGHRPWGWRRSHTRVQSHGWPLRSIVFTIWPRRVRQIVLGERVISEAAPEWIASGERSGPGVGATNPRANLL